MRLKNRGNAPKPLGNIMTVLALTAMGLLASCSGGAQSEENPVTYAVDTYKLFDASSWEAIQRFVVSSDGERVVYEVYNSDPDHTFSRILSVPLIGGPAVELFNTDTDDRFIHWYEITPDGSHVVISATSDYGLGFRLYSVPIGGGELLALNEDPTVPYDPNGPSYFIITPDGRSLLYAALATEDLRIVPVTGGPSMSLSGPLKGTISALSFQVDPKGDYAVYTAKYEGDDEAVYSVSLKGGEPIRLSRESVHLPYPVDDLTMITPDGGRVIYVYATVGADVWFHIAGVPITGGEAVHYLQSPDTPHMELSLHAPYFLGEFREYDGGPQKLLAVSTIDGRIRNLSEGLQSPSGIRGYGITPEGGDVIVAANYNQEEFRLFRVSLEGGRPVQLVHSPVQEDGGAFVGFGEDGKYALYSLYYFPDGGLQTRDVYSIPLKGGASRYLCSTRRFVVSPDNEWLLCGSGVMVPTTGGVPLDPTGGVSTMAWYSIIPTFAYPADKTCIVWTSQAAPSSPSDLFVGVLREIVEE